MAIAVRYSTFYSWNDTIMLVLDVMMGNTTGRKFTINKLSSGINSVRLEFTKCIIIHMWTVQIAWVGCLLIMCANSDRANKMCTVMKVTDAVELCVTNSIETIHLKRICVIKG